MILNCAVCVKPFITYPSKILLGRGKYCSKKCCLSVTNIALLSPDKTHRFKKGVRHDWRAHRSITKSGYVEISAPDHPHKTKRGYVREHRLVVEKALGRYLERDEDVHHVDGNKQNNHIDNLRVMTHVEHIHHHGPLILKRWAKKKGGASPLHADTDKIK